MKIWSTEVLIYPLWSINSNILRHISYPCFQIWCKNSWRRHIQFWWLSVIDPSMEKRMVIFARRGKSRMNRESKLGRGGLGWCARVCIGIRKTSKRMRVNWRATVTQPIPDMDTCLYRLHQLRPTNQTRISPVRCTNRAWPFSTLLSSTSSLSRPSLSPSPSFSPFSRLSPLPAVAPFQSSPSSILREQSPQEPFSWFSVNLASRRLLSKNPRESPRESLTSNAQFLQFFEFRNNERS